VHISGLSCMHKDWWRVFSWHLTVHWHYYDVVQLILIFAVLLHYTKRMIITVVHVISYTGLYCSVVNLCSHHTENSNMASRSGWWRSVKLFLSQSGKLQHPYCPSVLNITSLCCKCEKCTAIINLKVKGRKPSRKLKGLQKN
jgi:hypothetical protein